MKTNHMKYRKIWESHYGEIPKDEHGRTYEIHHKDGNRKNNDITNLMCLSLKEHYELHLQQGDYAAAAFLKQKIGRTMSGWNHSDETKNKISLNNKGMVGKTHSDETKRKMSEARKGIVFSDDHKNKLSEAKKKNPTNYWLGKSRKGMVQNHPTYECPHCGKIGKGTAMFKWHFDNCKKALG
jgi:hypothetical protein